MKMVGRHICLRCNAHPLTIIQIIFIRTIYLYTVYSYACVQRQNKHSLHVHKSTKAKIVAIPDCSEVKLFMK